MYMYMYFICTFIFTRFLFCCLQPLYYRSSFFSDLTSFLFTNKLLRDLQNEKEANSKKKKIKKKIIPSHAIQVWPLPPVYLHHRKTWECVAPLGAAHQDRPYQQVSQMHPRESSELSYYHEQTKQMKNKMQQVTIQCMILN